MGRNYRGGYNVDAVEKLAKECELMAKSAEMASLKASNILASLQWQEIDTAPKGGRYISVCMQWDNYNPEEHYFPETVKWYEGKWVDKKGTPIDFEPTHWIGLPTQPGT